MMHCFKCGSFTTFKVYFKESAKTVIRFACASCIATLNPEKIVVANESDKTNTS